MPHKDNEEEYGAWVTDTQWQAICEKARFRCKGVCGEFPPVEDIDIFLDEDLCGSCYEKLYGH